MPRCITSTSPDDRSASRYLARRPSPVTVRPLRRLAKSLGSGQRKSPRLATTSSKRAPSITGASPRRTVSTSGSSGMSARRFLDRLAESDAVVERIGDVELQHPPLLLGEAGPVVAVLLLAQLAL